MLQAHDELRGHRQGPPDGAQFQQLFRSNMRGISNNWQHAGSRIDTADPLTRAYGERQRSIGLTSAFLFRRGLAPFGASRTQTGWTPAWRNGNPLTFFAALHEAVRGTERECRDVRH